MSVPTIFQYLKAMQQESASDLYITVGAPPMLRGDESLKTYGDRPFALEDVQKILSELLTSRQKREFDSHMEINTSFDVGHVGRFRISAYRQKQKPALVIRRIISEIPSFSDLNLPKILEKLSMEKRGLVLLTGMTGSGKSTTLAAMVNHRNQHGDGHIITIEDPIEYYHEHNRCVISQREVGVDTESYATALKNALRQRPDVILVGEIRDREVMEQALASAETGHLCLATIHTNNAYQAIERIVNLFPDDFANQIRLNLSINLKAIVSQRLLPSMQGNLVPAIEIMLNQGFIRELIMKGEIHKIVDVMEKNNSIGMCSFDQSILSLYNRRLISEDVALAHADKESDLKIRLEQSKISGDGRDDLLRKMDTSLISLSE